MSFGKKLNLSAVGADAPKMVTDCNGSCVSLRMHDGVETSPTSHALTLRGHDKNEWPVFMQVAVKLFLAFALHQVCTNHCVEVASTNVVTA